MATPNLFGLKQAITSSAAFQHMLDAIAAQGKVTPPEPVNPNLNFRDVKTPLLVLSALSALAPKGSGANAVPLFLQGAQERKSQNAQIENQRRGQIFQTQTANADRNVEMAKLQYQRAEGLRDEAWKNHQNQMEMDLKRELAAGKIGERDIPQLLQTVRDETAPGYSRASAMLALRGIDPIRYPFSDEDIANARKATPYEDVQTARAQLLKGTNTREDLKLPVTLRNIQSKTHLNEVTAADKVATLPVRIQKMQADIQKSYAAKGLNESQKALVDKKVANFDDEFKLRAANIYSQIAKRAQDGSPTSAASIKENRILLNSELSLLKGQEKRLVDQIKKAGGILPDLTLGTRLQAIRDQITAREMELGSLLGTAREFNKGVRPVSPLVGNVKADALRKKYKY